MHMYFKFFATIQIHRLVNIVAVFGLIVPAFIIIFVKVDGLTTVCWQTAVTDVMLRIMPVDPHFTQWCVRVNSWWYSAVAYFQIGKSDSNYLKAHTPLGIIVTIMCVANVRKHNPWSESKMSSFSFITLLVEKVHIFMDSFIFQPFVTLLRPAPDHPRRGVWNWFHWSIGYVALILSCKNVLTNIFFLT